MFICAERKYGLLVATCETYLFLWNSVGLDDLECLRMNQS